MTAQGRRGAVASSKMLSRVHVVTQERRHADAQSWHCHHRAFIARGAEMAGSHRQARAIIGNLRATYVIPRGDPLGHQLTM